MEDIDYTDDIFDNLWIKKYAPKVLVKWFFLKKIEPR